MTSVVQVIYVHVCAGLKSDGSIVAWGHSARGGDTQGQDESIMAQVVCGDNECVGLKTGGVVVTWGDSGKCGDS